MWCMGGSPPSSPASDTAGTWTRRSTPSGGSPSGTLSLPGDLGNTFSGAVTCVAVHGRDAAVGAVGQTLDGNPAAGRLLVRDAPPFGRDQRVGLPVTAGTTPPNCATATFEGLGTPALSTFLVYDTP